MHTEDGNTFPYNNFNPLMALGYGAYSTSSTPDSLTTTKLDMSYSATLYFEVEDA